MERTPFRSGARGNAVLCGIMKKRSNLWKQEKGGEWEIHSMVERGAVL